ncbi:MAG: hypothetical protein U0175_13565 [Caldilineaceae bacterium]
MPQNRASTYFDQIKFALEHYHDAATLAESSPLAAPYFLGSALRLATATAHERGEVLCREIDAALSTLWSEALPEGGQQMMQAAQEELEQQGRGARYDCLILELNYFKRRFKLANQSEIYNDILHISRASHDRYLATAVERLGSALLRRLRPSLRFEQPRLTHLVGRSGLLQQALEMLLSGKSVTLTGAGGVGKTSLGLALGEEWLTPALFCTPSVPVSTIHYIVCSLPWVTFCSNKAHRCSGKTVGGQSWADQRLSACSRPDAKDLRSLAQRAPCSVLTRSISCAV